MLLSIHRSHTFRPPTNQNIYSRFYASTKSYFSCELRMWRDSSRAKKRCDWLDFRHSIQTQSIQFVLSFDCRRVLLGYSWFAVVECDFWKVTLLWIRAQYWKRMCFAWTVQPTNQFNENAHFPPRSFIHEMEYYIVLFIWLEFTFWFRS